MEETRNAYKILVGKSDGKRQVGRPKCRWEDNIKIDLKYDMRMRNGFIWLRIRTSGGLL
jgi:hypothetical protein